MNKEAKKKKNKGYGGYSTGKAKGHLDTQMFPECDGSKFDRNIVKKTVNRRKKNISPYAFNLKEYKLSSYLNRIDENTSLLGKINSIKEAQDICLEMHGEVPKKGYESMIDDGVTRIGGEYRKYKTYLQNNSGAFRVWTWISQENVPHNREYAIAQTKPIAPQTYYYFINLDERGAFYADVRDKNDKTIFEIRDGYLLGDDESSIFEDGFMKNKNDLAGLKNYLISIGIMNQQQVLIKGN
jgi:hypothetical protein